MAWFVLVVSGLFEAVWATALGRVDGVQKIIPLIVFVLGLAVSMTGLAWAMRTLPTGTAYAVWVGIGAIATVGVAVAAGDETMTWVKALFLILIVAGVIGLKVAG
jgi:quaternary ammonium compound-resistance protein SugE